MGQVRQISCTFLAFMLGIMLIGCSSSSNEKAVKEHRDRARSLVEKQQFGEALTEYQQVVQLNPKDDEAYYQLALIHLRLGRPESLQLAHQALQKVVKLKGSRVDAHVQLAQLYFLLGQPAKAGLQADEILAVEPTHSDGHLIKGLSLVAEGRFQSGIVEIRKAIEADPKNRVAYLELGRIYAQQRNFSEAEAILRDGGFIPASVQQRCREITFYRYHVYVIMRCEPPSWRIELRDEFDREFAALDADVQDNLLAALQAIRLAGAKAGRPCVGTLKGSKHANMKEMRFDAHGGTQVWRAAFAFDPERKAVVLVAGEKQGKNESLFYRRLIAIADARFDAHLGSIKRRSGKK